ncbi:Short transient receptor potential channel 5 [Orchesella cincta]|uniref:Short transient receptor potential channel 5 n=1 Tax=Orchesella cincta TaxID=48709 RepID=A0A1D2MNU3_ORCCI|nr:Short transient receptor potential channel 5 [Orchesella cincta]
MGKNKKDKKKGKSTPTTQNVSGSVTSTSAQNPPSPPPSIVQAPLSTLNDDEYEFFSMVSSGDTKGVTKYLSSPDFERKGKNINRFDRRGYTALHMAVRRQDEEMINILLKTPNIELFDVVLHAIREDNLEITKLLLKINDKIMREEGLLPPANTTNQNDDDEEVENKARPTSPNSGIWTSILPLKEYAQTPIMAGSKQASRINSTIPTTVTSAAAGTSSTTKKDYRDGIPFDSEFHEVITPLMLAAHVGSMQLVELFHKRGEQLETTYLTHNMDCQCPICGKLDGDGEMSNVHERYNLYKAICQPEYICIMAQQIKVDPVNYAIDKIVKLRDIMNRDPAYDQMYAEFIEELEKFCTDMLSMCRTTRETKVFLSPKDTLEKERLPHQNPRLWYMTGLDMKSFVAHPNTQNVVYHMWATDKWKDWESYGILYRLFQLAIRVVAFPLIALILFVTDGSEIKLGTTLGSPIGRFLNYVASYFVFLALVAFQVLCPYQRCNEIESYQINDDSCTRRGPPTLGTEWPIVIYVLSFSASMLKRQSMKGFYKMKWNCLIIPFDTLKIISGEERKFWRSTYPEVVGECFLSVATMLAFGRLLRFLQILQNVGPLQVILGVQISSFFETLVIFAIVLLSFSSALLGLYAPYGESWTGLDDHNHVKQQDDEFSNLGSILPHLFNRLGDPGPGGDLLIWHTPINETEVMQIHHKYTQRAGKSILAVFQIVGVLMMYNMLTGYFGQTMGDVLTDSDRIWKFTRTEMYLTHIKDTVLPPPFNLFPTLKTLRDAMRYFTLIGKNDDPKAACSFRQCCYITGSQKSDDWKELNDEYRALILELVFRYFRFRKETQEQEQATRDDVLEIGEEITELKEKLRIDGKVGNQEDDNNDSDDDDFYNFPRQGRQNSNVRSINRSTTQNSGGGGRGQTNNSPGPANPVITTQPRGSPQAGTSGSTMFNPSPVTKPPAVPNTPPAGQPPTGYSFSKPSSPAMNAGVIGSAPTMQMNNPTTTTTQMVNYQTHPKGNQTSYTMVRTDSSSLMNVGAPTLPKTPSPPNKTNSKGDLNRNESDSLYGSTTVANVAYFNNNNDERFHWDDSALKKYPPSIFQQKKSSFKGKLNNSDTWDQSPLQKFPPPIVRENLEQMKNDFGSPKQVSAPTKLNPRDSSTWDVSALQNFPPPIVRETLKERADDFGGITSVAPPKINPRDSSTWDKTPLLSYPPPIVQKTLKERADDFGGTGGKVPTKLNPRDSSTWDASPVLTVPSPIVRENLKQMKNDFGSPKAVSAPTKLNPRDSSTWDVSPLQNFPPPVVRDNFKDRADDFNGRSVPPIKPKLNPRDSSTWDKTPLFNYPPPIARENLKDKVDDFGTPSPGSSGSDSFSEATPSETWDESVLEKYPPPYFRGNSKQN